MYLINLLAVCIARV